MNQLALTESKTIREEYMDKDYVLEKVKALALLPNTLLATVDMVANYYEVGKEAIQSLVKDNREEVELDGAIVFSYSEIENVLGGQLENFKIPNRGMRLFNRRSILRVGMLLRDSEVAKQVRTYLLNVEENTDTNTRLMSITQDTNNKVKLLESQIEEVIHNNTVLINKIDELLEQPLFKMYENASLEYEKLMIEFTETMVLKGYSSNYAKNYCLFNEEFSNWTGVDFGKKKVNKKDYWLTKYGLEIIKHFIYGVKQNIIVKSNSGNWIDLNGIYNNKIEWQKTLLEFNNSCAYCGKTDVELLSEHMIPKTNEGCTNRISNIVPSCYECNSEKLDKRTSEWYTEDNKKYTIEKYNKIVKHNTKYLLRNK